MDERDRLKAELNALDTRPDVPGIQSGYDVEPTQEQLVDQYNLGYQQGYAAGRLIFTVSGGAVAIIVMWTTIFIWLITR